MTNNHEVSDDMRSLLDAMSALSDADIAELGAANAALAEDPEFNEPNIAVVRLSTGWWCDNRGLHMRKDITFLQRRCAGFNILAEDLSAVGAEETAQRIVNLDLCEDGVYVVNTCNEQRDWEAGYIDEYDLRLDPFDNTCPHCGRDNAGYLGKCTSDDCPGKDGANDTGRG